MKRQLIIFLLFLHLLLLGDEEAETAKLRDKMRQENVSSPVY